MWRYRTNFTYFGTQDFYLALDESTFTLADWTSPVNGQIDLNAIDRYGFYVGEGPTGSGIFYVDNIRLLP